MIAGENLSYGEYKSGADVLMALFIDDGVPDRGHRAALQNPGYTLTGIASCKHNSKYRNLVVFAYASAFTLNRQAKRKIN